jgi:hypothetical protein
MKTQRVVLRLGSACGKDEPFLPRAEARTTPVASSATVRNRHSALARPVVKTTDSIVMLLALASRWSLLAIAAILILG